MKFHLTKKKQLELELTLPQCGVTPEMQIFLRIEYECIERLHQVVDAQSKDELWVLQTKDEDGCVAESFSRSRGPDDKWGATKQLLQPPKVLQTHRVYEILIQAGSINNQDEPEVPLLEDLARRNSLLAQAIKAGGDDYIGWRPIFSDGIDHNKTRRTSTRSLIDDSPSVMSPPIAKAMREALYKTSLTGAHDQQMELLAQKHDKLLEFYEDALQASQDQANVEVVVGDAPVMSPAMSEPTRRPDLCVTSKKRKAHTQLPTAAQHQITATLGESDPERWSTKKQVVDDLFARLMGSAELNTELLVLGREELDRNKPEEEVGESQMHCEIRDAIGRYISAGRSKLNKLKLGSSHRT